jgi:hypothetical protein
MTWSMAEDIDPTPAKTVVWCTASIQSDKVAPPDTLQLTILPHDLNEALGARADTTPVLWSRHVVHCLMRATGLSSLQRVN